MIGKIAVSRWIIIINNIEYAAEKTLFEVIPDKYNIKYDSAYEIFGS